MDHAELVAALRNPAFYDPTFHDRGVAEVEFRQTHISSVFLAGPRAYKLKKPVNFGFLDFSTLALREHYCRRELELNRRFAPNVYLEVAPIVLEAGVPRLGHDGDAEPLDWLVVMRRLDERLHGRRLAEGGDLDERRLDGLAELLVRFYATARSGEDVDRHGTLEAVRFNTDENFAQTLESVGKLIARSRYDHLRKWTAAFIDEHSELFARRVAQGRIRDGHGDLHLGNVFFEDPPVVFDCIEFSDRLRCCDVAADVAFLAMDLDFHGRPDLSRRFVDRFVELSGDGDLTELLGFYKCYRAYVRAKVAAFTASDPALSGEERRAQRNLARRHFGLAHRNAGGDDAPPLVLLYGLMGTGKTALARFLRERFGWHVLSTDAVRKQISGVGENTRVYVPYEEGLYSPAMNERTYAEVCNRAENLLHAGFPVAVDGAFKRRRERQPVLDLARRTGARLVFVELVCDPAEQVERLERRRLHDTRSDGRAELLERQRGEFEPPDPDESGLFEELSTEGSNDDTRRRLVALLRSRGALAPPELVHGGPARS
jgi:aminoglycoside phosphotransferase family enzyme/predicted kinase